MCGIVGFTGFAESAVVRNMCARLKHRGPNDSGFFETPEVSLGMRRLAIVDIESGQQPVFNETRDIAAVCNGELYNFPALRHSLREARHALLSDHADSEVCPHAFEEWGERWVNKVNGMFAIALWDAKAKRLFLYRDRLGKKPLYYAHIGRDIIFASEIKALLEHPAVPRALDYGALGGYFACKAVPQDRTVYQAIRQLPPGSLLRWQDGEIQIDRYWRPNFTPGPALEEDEAAAEILRLLDDAVQLRMHCDVPFGAYLSGGVDSSAVTALMARHLSRPVQTFSLGYADGSGTQMRGKSADIAHARQMASLLGTEHHELFLSARGFAEAMPQVIAAFDQPFSGTVSTYFLSALIARHVTVALSGDGADELFGSYLTHRLSFPMAAYLAEPERFRGPDADRAALAPFDSPEQFAFLQRIADARQAVWYDRLSVFNEEERRALLRADVFPEGAIANPYSAFASQTARQVTAQDALNRTLEMDQSYLLPDQILPFVDRLSMAHSIEVRCPFLDYRLVEFVNSLPGAFKIQGGVNKRILKRALSGLVPETVLLRPKEGFVQPIYTWMREELRTWIEDLLASLPREAFNENSLDGIFTAWRDGRSGYEAKIWNLACFSLWWNAARLT